MRINFLPSPEKKKTPLFSYYPGSPFRYMGALKVYSTIPIFSEL
jgi:hypothetical protein